jgi:hypothetical protein
MIIIEAEGAQESTSSHLVSLDPLPYHHPADAKASKGGLLHLGFPTKIICIFVISVMHVTCQYIHGHTKNDSDTFHIHRLLCGRS